MTTYEGCHGSLPQHSAFNFMNSKAGSVGGFSLVPSVLGIRLRRPGHEPRTLSWKVTHEHESHLKQQEDFDEDGITQNQPLSWLETRSS